MLADLATTTPPAASAPLLVRQTEAARILGISQSSIRRAIEQGDLRPVRLGRSVLLKRADLMALAA